MNNVATLPLCIIEEIGFEGLEGITIEGLWKRLGTRLKLPLPLNNKLTNEIWQFILDAKCLQFYELEEEREPLKVFDRADSVDPFFAAAESDSCPYNFYKYNPISTQDIRGSCEHFDTRKEMPKDNVANLTAEQMEEGYGRFFVIVASQSVRTSLLFPPTISRDIELSIAGYCILERLGRARFNGELAHGRYSLADIGGDPVSFHHQKKKLLRNRLIVCQLFTQNIDGTNIAGQLVHLPRFFAQFKPRNIIIMEKIINILKSKPNCMAEYQEVKGHFEDSLQRCLTRLFKTPFFHQFVLTDTKVPYRAVYPNAAESEWKLLKRETERTVNVLQLRDPNIEPGQFYAKFETADDQDDDEEDGGSFLDDSHLVRDLPLLHQLYKYIASSEEKGVSESEASAYLGQSKLNGRALIRNLLKDSTIEYYSASSGRQTFRRYVIPKHNKKYKQSISDIINNPPTDDELTAVESDEALPVAEMLAQDVKIEQNESFTCDEANDIESEDFELSEEFHETESPKTEQERVHKSQIDEDIAVQIIEIDETDPFLPKRNKSKDNMLTEKAKERLKFIQREVQSKIIFEDPSKLFNALKREEQMRGLSDVICRKTYLRLLMYLCKMKQLRMWRIQFQYQSKHRSLLYISNKGVDSNFSLMQSCIDQAKSRFKLNIYEEEHRKGNRKTKLAASTTDYDKSDSKVQKGQKLTTLTNLSFNYGTTPKFVRLRTLHEFMFYLARQLKTTEPLNQVDIVTEWAETSPKLFHNVDEMPMVWHNEIGWKMFVPPLIKHKGFDTGWCLLSDCLFRMPLSIFVKVINISYEIKGLDEFVSHPIKKHYLVKDIPIHLQQMLFTRRTYISTMHDLICRLICIGLVQAGPHRALKDQAFYYLNYYARLIDTSASDPGTYYVSEKDYPQSVYKFNSLDDVFTYWDDMHRICMSTKLFLKPTSNDRTPADKGLPKKFAPYTKAIQPRQAEGRDIGELPGDQRGAAGLDSYLFAHLERNWAFNPTKFKQNPKSQMKPKSEASVRQGGRLVRVIRDANMKKHESRITAVPLHKLKSAAIRRRGPIIRKKATVVKRKGRTKYDDIDRMALQHMNKLRVDWNTQEDNFLLLCRVAQMYLNPHNRLMMSGQVIRDLIHWHCKSLNKTTFACRRRINYICKKLPNSNQINSRILMRLNEIKGDKSIMKRFGENFIHNLKKVYPDEMEFNRAFRIHFIDLVHTLSCQFYNLTNNFESNTLILPRTIQEFNARYFERNDSVYDSNTMRYDEPKSVDDIKIASIVTLIHSTVCCCYDKTSWSIQLYEIYKDFPERLLSLAMRKVRSDQMISQSKISSSSYNRVQNRCLPLSSSGFHLSATYQQQMTTKISYDLFDESYTNLRSIFTDIHELGQPNVLNLSHSAICFFIAEFLHKKYYDINIEMPKRILLLDPSKRLPDESFDGIYARFHEIFNYIPKVDLVGGDDSTIDEIISDLQEDKSSSTNETKNILKKFERLPPECIHFFCIIDQFGTTKPRNQIEWTDDGKCPFSCIQNIDNPTQNIMDKLVSKREVWYRLNIEQFEFELLPAVVTIDEINIVAIYNFLVLKGSNATDEQRNANLDVFKQVSDIVDELLLENDKDFIDEDFGAEYDLRSDVKKKLYDGAQINDKIHKFHDFLCVNTCKLSLLPKKGVDIASEDKVDLNQLSKQRDEILAKIVHNSNWSAELKSNQNLVDLLKEKNLTEAEIHVAVDVYNYIDSKGEMGANAESLVERYEDKIFLQKILNYFNEVKFVMKTGVCELTYVHSKHITPWVVNTYHLKRLERDAIEPSTKSLLHVSDASISSCGEKRKIAKDDKTNTKRQKIGESSSTKEVDTNKTTATVESTLEATPATGSEIVIGSAILTKDDETLMISMKSTNDTSKPEILSKHAKRFADISIEHGVEMNTDSLPQSKKTFPLKLAPWIRVNGSVNRRVLDKYAGTILLHCIENVGLTLFSLCTRFHYLLPIHVHELVEYLEEFGCLTKSTMAKQKPVTLFSTYESTSIGPATDLDDFKYVMIEPTIDAVSKVSVFIGNKKYKEDFI